MTTHSEYQFGDDRSGAIAGLTSIAAGRGWCNVVPCVEGDIPDVKVKFTGLWVKHGVAEASFVTSPPRNGVVRPSTLGILHLRGRLGKDRIAELLGDAPFSLKQDHSHRGLLFSVPVEAPTELILDVMCSMTASLCDYELTGDWRFDLYERD